MEQLTMRKITSILLATPWATPWAAHLVADLGRPYLAITAVPLPGAFWLAATGILCLAPRAFRHRRTA